MNGLARASRLDVGFDRRLTEPEDPRDVGVALALPGQVHAFALARLQPGGAHLPKPAAVHDPPRRLKGEAADDLNGADIAPRAIGRSRTTEIARAAALAEHESGNGDAVADAIARTTIEEVAMTRGDRYEGGAEIGGAHV